MQTKGSDVEMAVTSENEQAQAQQWCHQSTKKFSFIFKAVITLKQEMNRLLLQGLACMRRRILARHCTICFKSA